MTVSRGSVVLLLVIGLLPPFFGHAAGPLGNPATGAASRPDAVIHPGDAPLILAHRIQAQDAIERVNYNHRIWPKENPGPKPPFEQMITRAQLEAKVEDYLKKSAALEKFWQRPLTAEQLQAEMDRMAKQTKDPETLRELFAALDNNPYLIAECLARPILADRLIRNWYAFDMRFHGELKKEAEALREQLTPTNFPYLDTKRFHAVKIELEDPSSLHSEESPDSTSLRLASADFKKAIREYPEAGKISPVQETAEAFLIRWTERKTETSLEGGVIVFEKTPFDEWLKEAARNLASEVPAIEGEYVLNPIASSSLFADPTSPDSWKALWYAPEPRHSHTAVWTGSEMIIWGGYDGGIQLKTGGRYTPSTDNWVATSTAANCPSARYIHTAVWTGAEMIIWGGRGSSYYIYFNTGGKYSPSLDTWVSTSTDTNCPSARRVHTAIWTGSEMVIWGGEIGYDTYTNTGGRYMPSSDTWAPTSTGNNCPSARYGHTAVWAETEMIVWGGFDTNTGGRYDPTFDTWTLTSTGANCPEARHRHTAIWTGSEMIIWGGWAGVDINSGGKYSPSTDSWIATSIGANCPSTRESHTAIWSGNVMIIWGGQDGLTEDFLNTGGRYTPASNTWTPTSISPNCPAARGAHTAVWTGVEMIVWGGGYYDAGGVERYPLAGGRYAPSSDTWTPTFTGAGSPSPRYYHTAIWEGSEMIVWGGDSEDLVNTGGRYTPATESWTSTSVIGECPSSRILHTAIWTGMEMIVWGGSEDVGVTNTGGKYNPYSDIWATTSLGINCPAGRSNFSAVWTGTEMIVWGGRSGSYLNNGGRYNPFLDTWISTSIGANCPTARGSHTAVWTGSEMIIWGGWNGSGCFNTGGRYQPASNTWTPTSDGTNCPSARCYHTAIWSGTEMIIWGGYDSTCFNTGAKYQPSSNTWATISNSPNCPTARVWHTAIWTGTEMIIWGGYDGMIYFDTGGRYFPYSDSWEATPAGANCPPARHLHTAVWTGEEMIIWDGEPISMNGGILYPNTSPIAHPDLVTSIGGDGIFILGTGETLSLVGAASTDGSNPYTTTPYHDKLDSLVSYEWDLNGDAAFDTDCSGSASGVDQTGPTPAALSESDLAALGIASSGVYPVWLRVTDEVGVRACAQVPLTVIFIAPEVSPRGSAIPLRIARDPASSTGFYLYFEKIPPADGYNIYEGVIGDWYSHGDAPGSDCGTTVWDLGTGEMRAELAPDSGSRYYLVTTFGSGDEGPSGFSSSEIEIDPLQSTCPPQQ